MRWFRLCFVICAVTVALQSAAGNSVAPDKAKACAVPAFGADRSTVIQTCTALLQRSDISDEERTRLLVVRGRTYHMSQNLDAAIQDFEEAINLSPKDPELRVRRGWTALDKREFANAVEFAGQAVSLDANDADAYALLGAIGARAGNLGMAKAGYDKALELKPDDVVARFNRYLLYKRVHAHDAALKELDTLLQSQNADLDTRFAIKENREMSYRTVVRIERVELLEKMGRYDDSERAASELVELEPGPVSFAWRGFVYLGRSQFEKAQADADRALSYHDGFWLPHSLQGHIFLYTRQYEPAVESFTQAIGSFPESGKNYWGRAIALRALKRFEDATNDALKAVEIDGAFANQIVGKLTKLGYLNVGAQENDLVPAERDAVRACMLDERCW